MSLDVDPGHPSIHAVIVRVLKTQYNEEVNKSDQDSDDGMISSQANMKYPYYYFVFFYTELKAIIL